MKIKMTTKSYAGKRVFITGTTGFLGKTLLESIIRTQPDIGHIYLLVRGSKKLTAQDRATQEIFQSPLFNTIKSQWGDIKFASFVAEKVTIVDGLLTQRRYGLADEEFERLAKSLDLIINSAASVDFRERLDNAFKTNVFSVDNIIELSKANDYTPVLHISTCYTNGFREGLIVEDIHPPQNSRIPLKSDGSVDVDGLITYLTKEMDMIKESTPSSVVGDVMTNYGTFRAKMYGFTDTYTFTKWLAEHRLLASHSDKHCSIVRPAIIESAIDAPVSGWIEGIKVADAVVFAYARGKTDEFPAKKSSVLDIVPVDAVVNTLILAGARTMAEKGLEIYQSATSNDNPITMTEFAQYVYDGIIKHHHNLPKLTRGKIPKEPCKMVSPTLFSAKLNLAHVATSNEKLSKKFKLSKEKIKTAKKLATAFTFYTTSGGRYQFSIENTKKLASRFPKDERSLYNVEVSHIVWPDYVADKQVCGIEQFALNRA